jgi:CheY-like chemotaxis protein
MNRKRILVVDDEIGFTRLLKLTLEQTNAYEVRVENWPERAVTAAREFRPDVILLDVVMPRMFGAEVAERLRADATLAAIPIVFFTAAVTKTSLKRNDGVISGFPFLAKPSSLEEVIERIEQRLACSAPAHRTASPDNRVAPTLEALTAHSRTLTQESPGCATTGGCRTVVPPHPDPLSRSENLPDFVPASRPGTCEPLPNPIPLHLGIASGDVDGEGTETVSATRGFCAHWLGKLRRGYGTKTAVDSPSPPVEGAGVMGQNMQLIRTVPSLSLSETITLNKTKAL